ncbi:RNA polymerase II C-terminal domain phosphatase-like 4 [Bienertia sinuspersici]
MTLAHGEINQIRDENLQTLISQKKLQLILDLDHTLIHTIKTEKLTIEEKEIIKTVNDVYSIFGGRKMVKLRPGIREFLKEVSSMFEVSVYTMGNRMYASEVSSLLESKAGFPKGAWVISKEDCLRPKRKRLDVVLSHERVILIVDDLVEVWGGVGKNNLVKIDRYEFRVSRKEVEDVDNELERVLGVLRKVHNVFFEGSNNNDNNGDNYLTKDVRRVLRLMTDNDKDHNVDKWGYDRKRCKYDIENMSNISIKRCSSPAAEQCMKLVNSMQNHLLLFLFMQYYLLEVLVLWIVLMKKQ